MKRVAKYSETLTRSSLESLAFEPAKRPDDRIGYCLGMGAGTAVMGGAPWPWVGAPRPWIGHLGHGWGTVAMDGAPWPWVGHRGHGWGHRGHGWGTAAMGGAPWPMAVWPPPISIPVTCR